MLYLLGSTPCVLNVFIFTCISIHLREGNGTRLDCVFVQGRASEQTFEGQLGGI